MKNNQKCLILCLCVVAVCAIVLMYLCTSYKLTDYRDLLFLTQCTKEESVLEHFGRAPEIVYHKNDIMPQLGWKLPKRKISNKVLIFTNRSALRFYVYIDEEGEVEYLFTSNS